MSLIIQQFYSGTHPRKLEFMGSISNIYNNVHTSVTILTSGHFLHMIRRTARISSLWEESPSLLPSGQLQCDYNAVTIHFGLASICKPSLRFFSSFLSFSYRCQSEGGTCVQPRWVTRMSGLPAHAAVLIPSGPSWAHPNTSSPYCDGMLLNPHNSVTCWDLCNW